MPWFRTIQLQLHRLRQLLLLNLFLYQLVPWCLMCLQYLGLSECLQLQSESMVTRRRSQGQILAYLQPQPLLLPLLLPQRLLLLRRRLLHPKHPRGAGRE